eukprot:Skav227299  [mRNA]  locus=scaffold2645:189690:190670:- [translate_table: standard]
MQDFYDILGNRMADEAVTRVLQHSVKPLRDLSQQIHEANVQEQNDLTTVCEFVIEQNKTRMWLQEQISHLPSNNGASDETVPSMPAVMPCGYMGDDAAAFLSCYAPDNFVPFVDEIQWELEHLQACQQGATLALAAIQWMSQLRWPEDVTDMYSDSSDWGISWLEMFMDFHLATGMFMPIRLHGNKNSAVYIPYDHQDALLWPANKRSAADQVFNFQKMLSNIQCILGRPLMPAFKSHKCSSLNHLNTLGKTTGLPCRPALIRPKQTIDKVKDYLSLGGSSMTLSFPFAVSVVDPLIVVEPQPEVPVEDRHRIYLRLCKRQSRLRR